MHNYTYFGKEKLITMQLAFGSLDIMFAFGETTAADTDSPLFKRTSYVIFCKNHGLIIMIFNY